jgi:glycosyltransferase involved in cell wall biosynthesis
MTDSVGIVIPAYQPDLSVLTEYVADLIDHIDPETIRIELDAPTDHTREQLAALPVTVNSVSGRRGKGAAITVGFETLDTEILAFVDADGSTPVPEVERIITTVTDRPADLVVGSRRHPEATVQTSQSPAREYLGDSFAWLARRFLDVNLYDYQCGAKTITAEGWQQVRQYLTQPGFAWDIDLIAVAGAVDLRVEEVPIEWHDHPDSTVPPVRTSVRLAHAVVRTHIKAQRLDPGPFYRTLGGVVGGSPPLIDQDSSVQNNE